MDRIDRMHRHLDLDHGRGIEIGPLDSPVVTRDRADVVYVDHTSTQGLRDKYDGDPGVDMSKLVDVDRVVGEGGLRAAFPGETVDWVLASHVGEHVPDFVGWLEDIAGVVTPGGRLTLAMPDRRFSFDARRRPTELADLVTAHLERHQRPGMRAVFDQFYRQSGVDTVAVWAGGTGLSGEGLHPELAMDRVRTYLRDPDYLDVHTWVWTDQEFIDLIVELADLGFVRWAFHDLIPTPVNELEFYVTLVRLPDDLDDAEVAERVRASVPTARGPQPQISTESELTRVDRLSTSEASMVLAKRRALLEARRTLARVRQLSARRR